MSQPFPLPAYIERPCDQNNRWAFSKADDFESMPPASWGVFHSGLGLMTRCPKCGGRAGLSIHSVDNAGNANPSYLCANSKCGFHVYVRLDGWDLGEKPAHTDRFSHLEGENWIDDGWKPWPSKQ